MSRTTPGRADTIDLSIKFLAIGRRSRGSRRMAEYLSGFGVCDVMRRREFILAFGGVAAWHLATPAQAAKLPTIGFLGPLTQSAQSEWTAAFVQRMREHGWIDG